MPLVAVAITLLAVAACTSTRSGPADFTGFSAGLTGAPVPPSGNLPTLPR